MPSDPATDDPNSLPDLGEKPKEKQSIRTSFRLTEEALEAKEWLADYWGITQKEAVDELSDSIPELLPEVPGELWEIDPYRREEGERKTLVISRRAKQEIERQAEAHDLSRDEVLDRTLRLVWHLLQEEQESTEEQMEKRRAALDLVASVVGEAEDVEYQLRELLGSDDRVYIRFGYGVQILMNLQDAIQEELEEATPVDTDDL